jgi:hypothetical protein
MTKRLALVLVLHAIPALAGRPPIGASAPVDRPVAFVFRQPIWQSELDEHIAHLQSAPDAAKVDATLDALVDDAIVTRVARQLGITVDDSEIDRAVAEIQKQNQMTQAAFEKALADAHYTLAQYRTELGHQLVVQHFVARQLSPKIPGGGSVDDRVKQLEQARVAWVQDQRQHAHVEKPAAAPAGKIGWTELVDPIRKVDVRFADAALAAKARSALAQQVGHPIDRARLRGALASLLSWPGIADVHAAGVQAAGGVTLVVELVAQPKLHALTLREDGGGVMTPSPDLAALVGKPLDPIALDSATASVADRYRERGYLAPVIDWKSSPAGAGLVDVAVVLAPGLHVVIDDFQFHGNAHAKRDELASIVAADFPRGTPWQADRVEHSALLIQSYYWDRGYVQIHVDSPTPTTATKTLVFEIHEGELFNIGDVAVTGLPADEAKREVVKVQAKLKRGMPFSRSITAAVLDDLRASTSAKEVIPLTELDTVHKTMKLTLEVHR